MNWLNFVFNFIPQIAFAYLELVRVFSVIWAMQQRD